MTEMGKTKAKTMKVGSQLTWYVVLPVAIKINVSVTVLHWWKREEYEKFGIEMFIFTESLPVLLYTVHAAIHIIMNNSSACQHKFLNINKHP